MYWLHIELQSVLSQFWQALSGSSSKLQSLQRAMQPLADALEGFKDHKATHKKANDRFRMAFIAASPGMNQLRMCPDSRDVLAT